MTVLLVFAAMSAGATVGYFLGHGLGDRKGFVEGVRFGRLLQMSRASSSRPVPEPLSSLAGRELDATRRRSTG